MSKRWKYLITLVLLAGWVYGFFMVNILSISDLPPDTYDRIAFLSLIMFVLTVVLFTFVWRSDPYRITQAAFKDAEKPKRAANADEKMRLLLEMMDDDERYAFKQAMKERMLSGSRDGELNYDADSLGTLFDEDDYPQRRKR